MDIDASIKEHMGDSHIETTYLARTKSGDYRVTQRPLSYTDSFDMMVDVLNITPPDFMELWSNQEGWSCNLMYGEETFKSRRQASPALAVSFAFYTYIKKEDNYEHDLRTDGSSDYGQGTCESNGNECS